MSMFLKSIFGRWRPCAGAIAAERDLRDALFELNDHLLRDVGLRRPGHSRKASIRPKAGLGQTSTNCEQAIAPPVVPRVLIKGFSLEDIDHVTIGRRPKLTEF